MPQFAHDLAVERRILERFAVEPRQTRAELRAALGLDKGTIDGSLSALFVKGIVLHDGDDWLLTPAVAHLALLSATPNGAPDKATMDRILARRPSRELHHDRQ
jgi:DNA-binding IclR family transcriptional regulator